MSRLLKFWPVAAALVGFLWWKDHEAGVRREGALQEMARGLNARNAELEDEAGRTDTVYTVDTVRLRAKRATYDSARKAVLDSHTNVPDSHTVQFIAVADSTINACSVALQTCEARVALRDLRIAVLDSIIAVKDQQKPGWLKRTFGCAAGVGATTKGAGFGAACGVKWP